MPNITRRDAVLTGLGAAVAVPALTASASNATAKSNAPVRGKAISGPAKHKFEMNIEETRITLGGNQTLQTFAFGGLVPVPLFHVREGAEVDVLLNSLTTLNHSLSWQDRNSVVKGTSVDMRVDLGDDRRIKKQK